MNKAMSKAADRYFYALWKYQKAKTPAWRARWDAASRAAFLEYATIEAQLESASSGKHH